LANKILQIKFYTRFLNIVYSIFLVKVKLNCEGRSICVALSYVGTTLSFDIRISLFA